MDCYVSGEVSCPLEPEEMPIFQTEMFAQPRHTLIRNYNSSHKRYFLIKYDLIMIYPQLASLSSIVVATNTKPLPNQLASSRVALSSCWASELIQWWWRKWQSGGILSYHFGFESQDRHRLCWFRFADNTFPLDVGLFLIMCYRILYSIPSTFPFSNIIYHSKHLSEVI